MKIGDWQIGSKTPTPVAEYEATGEIERVYHEIRQSLRVTGVNLNFRTWAAFGKFLPAVWDQLRPNVDTDLFEHLADQVRAEALQAAESFGPPQAGTYGELGESRAYQVRAALELYHSVNPKLLVLTCAVLQALKGEPIGGGVRETGRHPRGEPARMYPMEMEAEKPEEKAVGKLYKDIRKTLSLPSINSDYRTLALWPDYLAQAWSRLKPICRQPEFQHAADQLRDQARALARQLPYPISLTLGQVKELGEDADQVLQTAESFERLLPPLILNIALLQLDWKTRENAPSTEAPPATPSAEASEPAWRAFQKRQRVLELKEHFISYIDEGSGEPVLLLHGIPTWGFLWEQTIAALSPRFRVLAPDLLGYGYSEKRDAFDRSLARQAELIDEFLSRVGIEAAHVIGHDLGGGAALRLATLFPKRVRSLGIMNSVCYDAWPVEAMLQLGHPQAARKLSAAKTLRVLRQGLLMGFHSSPDSAWLDGLLSPWRTEAGKLSLVRNASALDTNHTTEITRLLPAIGVPALVLWGEEDPLVPVKYGEWLARDIPGAALVRIAQARHFVMVDQPERVNSQLEQFLTRVSAHSQQAAA